VCFRQAANGGRGQHGGSSCEQSTASDHGGL
jgi:hypothetical protein